MFETKKVKVVVMISENYLNLVRNAILEVGVGLIGNYTHCSTNKYFQT